MEIKDKVVLVTGGGSGLGAQTAKYLSEKGAKIAILDLSKQAAEKTAEECQGIAIQCDVSNEEEMLKALEIIQQTYKALHVCINCAGIVQGKRIVGREGPMPLKDFETVIKINLIGTFNVMRLSAAEMIKQSPIGKDEERGVIINTASVAAFEGQKGQSAYSASKGGVAAMTLPAAREFAQFGIRVMTIAPGLIHTPLFSSLDEKIKEELCTDVLYPKRLGHPHEFAQLAAHIIENPYLNGEIIRLDAGLRMR